MSTDWRDSRGSGAGQDPEMAERGAVEKAQAGLKKHGDLSEQPDFAPAKDVTDKKQTSTVTPVEKWSRDSDEESSKF